MVLEHPGLSGGGVGGGFASNAGLQPALQLYAAAAAAAHLGPRHRVPPWAPFLQHQFGMFGNSVGVGGIGGGGGIPFGLSRPGRFGPALVPSAQPSNPGAGSHAAMPATTTTTSTAAAAAAAHAAMSAATMTSMTSMTAAYGHPAIGHPMGAGGQLAVAAATAAQHDRIQPGPASDDSTEAPGEPF